MRRSIPCFAAMTVTVLWSAFAFGQTTTTQPNTSAASSDAEINAFRTPTTGQDGSLHSSSRSRHSEPNPEARGNGHDPKDVQPNTTKLDGSPK